MIYPKSASQYVSMPCVFGVFSLVASVGVIMGTELGVTKEQKSQSYFHVMSPKLLFCSLISVPMVDPEGPVFCQDDSLLPSCLLTSEYTPTSECRSSS